MRSAQKSNRSRGRGNRKSGGSSGGNNINRVYDSAGPEGKVRGTPQQIIDKYTTLARDAQTSGDRVAAENFLQHAEHYQRILILAMGAQEQNKREQPPANGADHTAEAGDQDTTEAAQPAAEDVTQPGADQPDIGGMAMIDAGQAQAETLLVEADEMVRSQPKKNGRRRPQADAAPKDEAPAIEAAPASDPAPAEEPAAVDAPAATDETPAEGAV